MVPQHDPSRGADGSPPLPRRLSRVKYIPLPVSLPRDLTRATVSTPVEQEYDITDRSAFKRAGYRSLHFIEHGCAGDLTDWWVPNRACAEAMLGSPVFTILAQPEDEVHLCRRRPIAVPADGPHAVHPLPATGLP